MPGMHRLDRFQYEAYSSPTINFDEACRQKKGPFLFPLLLIPRFALTVIINKLSHRKLCLDHEKQFQFSLTFESRIGFNDRTRTLFRLNGFNYETGVNKTMS